jgi:pimeloyl-ACP methyl ester carboxylesterase
MELEVNGLRFYLNDEGEGRPVVLLHGFPDTSRLWRHQIDALSKSGHRCIAPDLRGRGRSERPTRVEDYGLAGMVRDITGMLAALGIERADLVGHDWGAALAWLVASLAPERVDRLVVLSVGFPGAASAPKMEALQKAWYRILIQSEGVAEDLFRKDDFYLMRELLQGHGDLEEYLADLADPAALTAGFNWYRANVPLERLLGPPPPLPLVNADTLGMFGTSDPYLVEADMTASQAKVNGRWRYERLEGVGHWIPLDAPEVLNRLLVEFLA